MTYDLCAVGNALVDIFMSCDDSFLSKNAIAKGAMTLVDASTSDRLYGLGGPALDMTSGGSAANTLAGFSSFGGSSAFIGKIGHDQFGDAFTHDLRAQNVHFSPHFSPTPTGRCMAFVTPDTQRSMLTYLGAAGDITEDDIDEELIENSLITYLEGYLFDKPQAQAAFHKAASTAHRAGRKLAMTLSDSFCVINHRKAFLELIEKNVDILFANESEIMALYETPQSDAAIKEVSRQCEIAVITKGASGAVITHGGQAHTVPAEACAALVDTTGAGDLYAAGFLFGLTHGKDVQSAGRLGALAASEIISHYGPRPHKKLSDFL